MEGWRRWQNGTLGGIAERDQVCLAGLPSPSSRIYIHTQPLPHLPVSLQHCLQQMLQGGLVLLLRRLSPLSSCLGAPRPPFFSNPGSRPLRGWILAALQDVVGGEPGGLSLVDRHDFLSGHLRVL